jgi:hypothetical protein
MSRTWNPPGLGTGPIVLISLQDWHHNNVIPGSMREGNTSLNVSDTRHTRRPKTRPRNNGTMARQKHNTETALFRTS